jgi:dethiobiotin synthetase
MSPGARGVFVTGTDTGVGKTVVAAVIARGMVAGGRRVAVFKPALTGLAEPGEPDHEVLRRAAGSRQSPEQVAPYRFEPPLSPHLAARLAGEAVDPAELRSAAASAAEGAEALVCEGVGGLLVPLTPGYLVRDFARDLELPLVIAAAPGLGTINHTLLTAEAARAVGLEVCCVVLTPWPSRPGEIETSNRETIAALARTEVAVLEEIDLTRPQGWPPPPRPVAERLRR